MKKEYESAFHMLVKNPESEDVQTVRDKVLDRHNEYVLQLRAANRTIEQFKHTLPEVLEVSAVSLCKHIKGSKELCLFGQHTTCKFSG